MRVSGGIFLPPYLVSGACFDEVFLKDVVECRVQLLPYILDQKGAPKRQTVLQMILEVLMVQWGDLGSEYENSIIIQILKMVILWQHVMQLTSGSIPFLNQATVSVVSHNDVNVHTGH